MPKRNIPVAGPWITDLEHKYVSDAVSNAWYQNSNYWNNRFEESFANYIGVKYAISLPHCTSAIHLALLSLEIGPGDEVIVPDITWIASAAPIKYVGADVVFAEVDRKTWCLTANSIEKVITKRTKAIISVDLYGSMPNYEEIKKLSDLKNIHLIEDSAEAIGSKFKDQKAGIFGKIGVFSFHGSKTLTTGEGGMLVTDDEDIKNKVLFLRDHGRVPGDTSFTNTEVAYKYKMSSFQAAFGAAQIERIESLVNKKREIFKWYKNKLEDLPFITLNAEPENYTNSFWMSTIIISQDLSINKDILMKRLLKDGINTRPFFNPLSTLKAFRNEKDSLRAQKKNIVSKEISLCGINLPSALCLTENDINYVCDCLLKILIND